MNERIETNEQNQIKFWLFDGWTDGYINLYQITHTHTQTHTAADSLDKLLLLLLLNWKNITAFSNMIYFIRCAITDWMNESMVVCWIDIHKKIRKEKKILATSLALYTHTRTHTHTHIYSLGQFYIWIFYMFYHSGYKYIHIYAICREKNFLFVSGVCVVNFLFFLLMKMLPFNR